MSSEHEAFLEGKAGTGGGKNLYPECKEKHPKYQFSAKLGTIMEDNPLGLMG